MVNLEFKLPAAEAEPGDKIRMLAPEVEYLLKQYHHFVIEQEIDHELLQMDSAPGYLSDVPSLVFDKYLCSNHPRIKTMQYYFFEPYSILAGSEGKGSAKNLYTVLRNARISFSSLEDYQKNFVRQLEKEGFLTML